MNLLYNYFMSRQKNYQFSQFVPEKCWVGDIHKICYATKEEAEVAAKVAEHDHGAPQLSVYKCEYGNHWHLSSGS